MTKEKLMKELEKLAPTTYENDFRIHLSSLFKKYLELLKLYGEQNKIEYWDNAYTLIKRLTDGIKESVKRIYQGQHYSAYSLLRKRLNDIPESYGLFIKIKENQDFFRMRVFDEKSKEKPSYLSLFHIPFSMRGIVKTERYSMPGYPCLYLGGSSYVCWEEMNRPNLNKCYVARFKTNKEFLLFNMSLSLKDLWENDKYFMGLLIRFPLIIASMVEVKNKEDVFKPEYIIPQLIMEWIMEKINSKKSTDIPIGIFYTSVHIADGFDYPNQVFDNLAIPAQSPFAGRYSKELCNIFSVSEPTCDEIEHAKGTYNTADNIMMKQNDNIDEERKKISAYQTSIFGVIEKQLRNNQHDYPLKEITPR